MRLRFKRQNYFSAALIMALMSVAGGKPALGAELQYYYRSARAAAMGNAFVGLADDEQSLWLNPAGLSKIQSGQIHYATIDLEASNDVIFGVTDLTAAFKDFSLESINAMMGRNTYGRAQITPSLLLRNFGVGILIDAQVGMFPQNEALPEISLLYQTTMGVQAGYSFSLLGGRRSRYQRSDLNVGITGKMLWRRGGVRTMTPIELLALISSAQGRGILSKLAGPWQAGYGADAGIHFTTPVTRVITIGLGSSFTNLGNVSFGESGNEIADEIPGNWTLGTAVTFDLTSFMRLKVAYDYSHILQVTDKRQKNHIGVELDMPLVDVFAGLNQLYITYGVSVDLYVMKIYAVSYAVERGTILKQDPDRRYLLQLDFGFTL